MNDVQIIQKLDDLQEDVKEISQALVTLARIEERQDTANKTIERLWTRIELYEQRIDAIERKIGSQTMQSLLWTALVVAGSVIGYLLNMVQA